MWSSSSTPSFHEVDTHEGDRPLEDGVDVLGTSSRRSAGRYIDTPTGECYRFRFSADMRRSLLALFMSDSIGALNR
jgi:hypothetical protein